MSLLQKCAAARISVRILAMTLGLALGIPPLAMTASISRNEDLTPLLVKSRVPLTPDVVSAICQHAGQPFFIWPEIQSMAVRVPPSKIEALSSHPLVEFVERDLEAGILPPDPTAAQSAPAQSSLVVPLSSTPIQTWNQDMADTPGSGRTGAGVTVAVVDAGLPQNWQDFLPPNSVDLEHAAGFGAEGWGDFHSELHAVRGVGGHIGLFPHGLAVSSVISGFPSEFGPVGGAAPDAKTLPVRVLNQFNSGWFSWFTAGILYVANLKASGAVPGPMVINFSIQAHSSSGTLAAAIDYAISQGVLFVTIAGNFNPSDYVSFPGRLPQSITAAAAGWRREFQPPDPWFFGDVPENDPSQVYVAPFSGREPPSVPAATQIDVLAPGSFVFGEWLYGPGFSEGREVAFDGVDNFIFGTSFAAPHVAGIVAQMLEKNPALTQAEAEAILRGTALGIPPGIYGFPWDNRATGAGLARGAAAVAITPSSAVAAEPARVTAKLAPDPSRSSKSSGTLRIKVSSRVGSLPVEFAVDGSHGNPPVAAIFDPLGRRVRFWTASAAEGTQAWDGTSDVGSPVGAGVYFLRVEAGGRRAGARLIVTR